MIEESSGDLFAASTDAVVNAVNCAGVMGKGLALAFKKRFPDNFAAYKRACDAGAVAIGKMFVVERADAPRWIINFPTKRHWRGASTLADVKSGLVDLVDQVERRGIRSIAIPALGCGLGGLRWEDVRPAIVEACERWPAVRCVLFPPR